MIFDANKILEKVTSNSGHKSCTFRVSKSIFEKFKKVCKRDKVKYSSILEEIIRDFISYAESEQPIKIYVVQAKDRTPASISCSTTLWETFSELLNELCLDRGRTLEHLMEEYCKQRSQK